MEFLLTLKCLEQALLLNLTGTSGFFFSGNRCRSTCGISECQRKVQSGRWWGEIRRSHAGARISLCSLPQVALLPKVTTGAARGRCFEGLAPLVNLRVYLFYFCTIRMGTNEHTQPRKVAKYVFAIFGLALCINYLLATLHYGDLSAGTYC